MLDSFNGKDQMVAPAILGAAGNCYAQLGQLDKAASTLMSAADKADNNTLSPIFLMQAVGFIKVLEIKSENGVSEFAGADICRSWNSKPAFFMHDIHKSINHFSGFGKFDFHIFLVVEIRTALVNIKAVFIGGSHFPDSNRNN